MPDVGDRVAQGLDLGELLAGRLADRQLRPEQLERAVHVAHARALPVAGRLFVIWNIHRIR